VFARISFNLILGNKNRGEKGRVAIPKKDCKNVGMCYGTDAYPYYSGDESLKHRLCTGCREITSTTSI
jgi:hypothetical protein